MKSRLRAFKPSTESLDKRDVPGVIAGYAAGPEYHFGVGNISYTNTNTSVSVNGQYLGQGIVSGSLYPEWQYGGALHGGGMSLSFGQSQMYLSLQQTRPGSPVYQYVVQADNLGVAPGAVGYLVYFDQGSSDTIYFE